MDDATRTLRERIAAEIFAAEDEDAESGYYPLAEQPDETREMYLQRADRILALLAPAAEGDALREDAERLDWLEAWMQDGVFRLDMMDLCYARASVRAAIDAVRSTALRAPGSGAGATRMSPLQSRTPASS